MSRQMGIYDKPRGAVDRSGTKQGVPVHWVCSFFIDAFGVIEVATSKFFFFFKNPQTSMIARSG